jgi:hypothetical protein
MTPHFLYLLFPFATLSCLIMLLAEKSDKEPKSEKEPKEEKIPKEDKAPKEEKVKSGKGSDKGSRRL